MGPRRGEVWFGSLSPTRGHEQGRHRPLLILSDDQFNDSGADLAIVLPLTTRQRAYPTRVEVRPPEGGLTAVSYVCCEHIRSLSVDRLTRAAGEVRPTTMAAVEDVIRLLLVLPTRRL